MTSKDLLDSKRNVFSQNGEDGIIEELFKRIGVESSTCCEFGAWDGIHLSNCRKLILDGWRALMIEADPEKTRKLKENYRDNPAVACVNRLVDAGENSVGSILREVALPDLDFLSIDIDGLDYEVFASLDVRPRVICIEVNAAFAPDAEEWAREIAATGIGQPMEVFIRIAQAKGYELICYSGNAFFVRTDVVRQHSLRPLLPRDAYRSFIEHLERDAREWLCLVNAGLLPPHRRYRNPNLGCRALGITAARCIPLLKILAGAFYRRASGYLQSKLPARQLRQ